MNTPSISFVMPCLNEAKTLPLMINQAKIALAKICKNFEILVADNNSQDNSVAIATRLGATVINVPEKGYGAALHHGILNSKYDVVVYADADCSYPPDEIAKLVTPIFNNQADFVLGSRLKGMIEPQAMPTLNRYLGTPILSFIIRLLLKLPVSDCNSGMRALNRKVYDGLELQCTGMEYASEMLVMVAKKNVKYMEVPINFQKDQRDRAPHLKRWRDGWRHLRFIVSHSANLFSILLPGLFATGCLLVAFILSLNSIFKISNVDHFHTAFALICLSIPCMLLSFTGVLGRFAIEKRLQHKSQFYYFLKKAGENAIPFYLSLIFFALAGTQIFYTFTIWALSHFNHIFEINSLVRATIFSFLGAVIFCFDLMVGLLNLLPNSKE